MYGEYLTNAQGEDVVAGIRTPKPIAELEDEMPEQYAQLVDLRNTLEAHYKEVQDYEFTIEKGTLYCLQTRNGKMNAAATVRTSVEMFREELLSRDEALLRVPPELLEQLLHPIIDPTAETVTLAQGLPASPGAASGKCVFDADLAEKLGNAGDKAVGRPERSMVTTTAPGSSGGINLASISRDVGGSGQGIGEVQLSRVASSIGGGGDGPDRPLSGGAPRTRETRTWHPMASRTRWRSSGREWPACRRPSRRESTA